MSSTRSNPSSSDCANGRICSSYSGSAPAVNPSIHQSAWLSHRSTSSGSTAAFSLTIRRLGARHPTDTVRPMKFSVWPNPGRPASETLELARLADSEGWHGIWFADHYMSNTGSEALAPGDVHECWAVLPAIAAVTERVRLGSLVAPTSIHHPAILANRAATIDHISDGRLVLGIGAGWQINEHLAYGIELEQPATRVDQFEEAIQIVRSLFSNERTTFAGEHYTITDA